MNKVDNFRLKFNNDDREYVPIMVGGMGVDISSSELALEAARLGGIGHISDALVTDVSDRKYDTQFVADKRKEYKESINSKGKLNRLNAKFRIKTIDRMDEIFNNIKLALNNK